MIGCNVCPDEKWEKGRVDCSVKDERMENKMSQFLSSVHHLPGSRGCLWDAQLIQFSNPG